MEKYHKQLDANQYQYYPENKKNYTTKKDELKIIFNFKNFAYSIIAFRYLLFIVRHSTSPRI